MPNPTAPGMPQRMVVILLDSLNRHLIRPNVVNDPAENEDRVGTAREERSAEELLVHALTLVEAPSDQFARLGLR